MSLLEKHCKKYEIPLVEIPGDLYYWGIIRHVMMQVFDKDTARLKYFKITHGYNKLTAPVVIKITKSTDTDVNNWTISKDGTVEPDKIIDIENSTGSILPSTGGRGAIAFAVIAALLVFGVAVSFIRDKRKEA